MNKILAMLLVSILFASLGVATNPVAGQTTTVKVDPSLIEYSTDATGQQFTVAIKIVDVTNLYGFDIKFRWNTTFLSYISRSIRIPKDTYPDGVLWNPILGSGPIEDQVNTTAGTYWIVYSSIWPAPSFNGSGTVFNMTFKVKYHPVQPQPDANVTLELYSTDLVGYVPPSTTYPISHTNQNGRVILHSLFKVIGDINGDGKVDIKDLVLVIKYFGSYPGHPTKPWNPNADVNGDNKVDIKDLVLVIKHFGEHYP